MFVDLFERIEFAWTIIFLQFFFQLFKENALFAARSLKHGKKLKRRGKTVVESGSFGRVAIGRIG